MKNEYTFTAKVWLYPGMAGNWHFVNLSKKDSQNIKEVFVDYTRGWGSIRVEVQIGTSKWSTSIFPDKKRGAYLLPLKASVRQKEAIVVNDTVKVRLLIIV